MSAIRFLVVDSSQAVQTFVKQLLEGYGFESGWIKTTHSPQAAAEIGADHQPDFLLTDWFVKEPLDGIGLHQLLRGFNADCRFALTSTDVSPTFRKQSSAAGAYFLLGKPFTAQDMRDALSKAMRRLTLENPAVAQHITEVQQKSSQPRPAIALPPMQKFQAGDRVWFQDRQDIVRDVIFRRGELVVQLQGVPGTVPAFKLRKV